MRSIAVFLTVFLFSVIPAKATNYYVSPSGNDSASGLAPSTAWLSPDNGDQKALLQPGDTVNILPGVYLPSKTIQFKSSGTDSQSIVYQKLGKGNVTINGNGQGFNLLLINGNHDIVKGLNLTNANGYGIRIKGDSCLITECYIYNVSQFGMRAESSNNLFLKNIIAFAGQTGIEDADMGKNNRYYGNTIYSCGGNGLEFGSNQKNARVFNCIIANNMAGIKGPIQTVCGFNNIWGNTGGNYVGVVDSAGGISNVPGFVDPANGRFDLMAGALEINAGLGLGYLFNQSAPDMGAKEKYNAYYVRPDGNDRYNGRSLPSAWRTIDNGDSLLYPGDTVYVMPGIYSDSVVVTDSGLTNDQIAYSGVRDSTEVDGSSLTTGMLLSGSHVIWSGIDVKNSTINNITIAGNNDLIKKCRIESAGTCGIRIQSGSDNKLEQNVIANNGAFGIYLSSPSSSSSFLNNTLYHNGGYGLFDEVGGTYLVNNIFVGHTSRAIWSPSSSQVIFSIFHNNTTNTGGGISLGLGCLLADPKLVDPAGNNFRLKSSSPAIDAGTYVGLPFNGTAPDLGAYETGILKSLSITPAIDSLFADSTYQFEAVASDSEGYPAKPGILNWSHSFTSGTINSAGLFVPELVGQGRVIVLSITYGISDTSADMRVVPGKLDTLRISPSRDTISADSTRQFSVAGFDLKGNNVSDPGNLSWEVLNGLGTIDSTGLFSASQAGYGFIRVTSDRGAFGITDTITVVPGQIRYIEVIPSMNLILKQTSYQYTGNGYDLDSNLVADITDSVVWTTTDSAGTITAGGLYTAGNQQSPPAYYVKATYAGSLSDSGQVTVIPDLHHVRIEWPDGREFDNATFTTDDDTAQLYCRGYNIGDSLIGDAAVDWSILSPDSIGFVEAGPATHTTLTLSRIGTGQVVATYLAGLTDTTGVIISKPGVPSNIVIMPSSATVTIPNTIQFGYLLFDADGNPVNQSFAPSWSFLGEIGTISSTGLFTPTNAGTGFVVCSAGGVIDTTGPITVLPSQLSIDAIPLGNAFVYPNQSMSPLLAFRIENKFNSDKGITGITVHNSFRGPGSAGELLTNVDSIALYLDLNGDMLFTQSDSLIDKRKVVSDSTFFSFSQITIHPDSSRSFFIVIRTSLFPHDGDSLDLLLFPGSDIQTSDETPIAGSDTINSLGYNIIDGMTANQVSIIPTGNSIVNPGDTLFNVLTVDIPRNGYREDTLRMFSVFNGGTAQIDDFDSLVLYKDSGNWVWGGPEEESRIGRMSFTGNQWSLTGVSVGLTQQNNRFYVAAKISDYPTNGASIDLGIPRSGLEMTSQNDGPIDAAVQPNDTISIRTFEAISVRAISIPPKVLVPSKNTGPIGGIELTNSCNLPVSIDSLRFQLLALDSEGATQEQLDSQIDSVTLWLNRDNDYTLFGSADSLLVSARINNGTIVFATQGLAIPAKGGKIALSIGAFLNGDYSKNGNLINIGISDSSAFYFNQQVNLNGSFPIKNDKDFVIDAFPASRVTINAISGATLFGGENNRLVLDFELPGNGYAFDQLRSISLINVGTTADGEALKAVKLWADSTGNGFSADDILVGQFSRIDSYWEISGLSFPLIKNYTRFFITVDIAGTDFKGGTLQFKIPLKGIEYWSGTNGPDDAEVSNPESHMVFPANRITAISIPRKSEIIYPGSQGNTILTFALYNGYNGQAKQLQSICLTNRSRSKSTTYFDDYELGQVSLYLDKNKNRTFDNDSLFSTGYFSNRKMNLTGLNVSLPPESLSYFFVVEDLPLDLIDSDSLAISMEEYSDFTFAQTVNLNGDLPLSGGGYLIVDGSVRDQYGLEPVTSHTLSPGDTSVVLFAFRPAFNGDLIDTLTSLTIANLGNADTVDISSIELWLDRNGDNIWESTDSFLRKFSYTSAQWHLNQLGLEVKSNPADLFIIGDVSLLARPNATFRGGIPLNGCQYASSNDGPIDSPLTSDRNFVISNSGLRVSTLPLNSTYSVGQNIKISFRVRNLLSTPIDSVLGQIVSISNPTSVRLDSSFVGPLTLGSGETIDFYYVFNALLAGEVFWQMRAFSQNTPDSSPVIETDPVMIQFAPTSVMVQLVSSIPTAVTRGQSYVFPFSLKCHHPDTSSLTASLRLDSLRIKVEDGTGTGQQANRVFSRMVLATGYTNLAVLESFTSDSTVLLTFSQPVILTPGKEQLLSLRVDIDSLAEANDFALAVESASAITFVDENTSKPVSIDPKVTFPLKTASCRIDNPSQYLAISFVPIVNKSANYGQKNVDVLKLVLRHPGGAGNSQIQLTSLSFKFVDNLGDSIVASNLFDEIKLLKQQNVIGELTTIEPGAFHLTAQLSAPPVVSPGQIDTLRMQVSIKPQSPYSSFGLVIEDSTLLTLRDLSSGSMLVAISDTVFPDTGSVFPIFSGLVHLNHPATAPEICVTSKLPLSVVGGCDSIALVELNLKYPAAADCSPILLKNVIISVLDTLGRVLDPYQLFNRIGFRTAGNPVSYQQYLELQNGQTLFRLGTDGIAVNPGDSLLIQLVGDIQSDAPFSHFVLRMNSDGIKISDATDTAQNPGFVTPNNCSTIFPFSTNVTQIFLPAGQPAVKTTPMPTQIGYPGQRGLTIFTGELSYNSTTPKGDLVIKSWRGKILKRTQNGLLTISGNQVFKAIHLYSENQLVATDSMLLGDSLLLQLRDEYVVSRGTSQNLMLTCDLSPQTQSGNYVIVFDDSSFMEFSDRNLLTRIYPVLTTGSYPLLSAEISLTTNNLSNSFTNYPNPFDPAKGEVTTIAFVLSEEAYVDIELFTITGELVKKLITNSYRSAGSHQQDTWSGLNDEGFKVVPGTYFCRITARYNSGKAETSRRKVAVIR